MTDPQGSVDRRDAADSETSRQAAESLLMDQLRHARDVKEAFESRAATVMTGSGTLVTLQFAALGFAFGSPSGIAIGGLGTVLIAASLLTFAAAAVCAMMTITPREYGGVRAVDLQCLTDAAWWRTGDHVRLAIAGELVQLISTVQEANERKANWLTWAARAEMTAILLLASGAGTLFTQR